MEPFSTPTGSTISLSDELAKQAAEWGKAFRLISSMASVQKCTGVLRQCQI
jgi:hypothetical protein